MSWIRKGLLAALVFTAGLIVGGSDEFGHRAHEAVENTAAKVLVAVSDERVDDVRMQLLMENPSLIRAIQGGGAFGNKSHRSIALGMFSRSEAGIAAARELIQIELVAPRTWLIRLPVSNAVLFETDEGLVLVETGVAAAGPALFDAVRSVSDAPLHTIIYTHAHVDHAYGTWAFLEAGERPEIVAHVAATKRFARYIRLRGSIAKYMNQPVNTMPLDRGDIAWPTRSFENRLDLEIGGESFVLQHHRAETDDQLYLWMPSRKVLVSSDYYQAWIPNAGNGKRVQRYVEEWAVALREMAGLGAELVLPGHGPVIEGSDEIRGDFILLAKALESIAAQTIAGLNAGLRKDEVWARVRLPAPLAADSRLQERYVSVQDISKMVIKQYTGWWDDIPSHWSPAPIQVQASALVDAAGGMEAFVAHGRRLIPGDLRLASHFADWAFFADPRSLIAQQFTLDVYKRRILAPDSQTQEKLAYLDQMVAVRQMQLEATQARFTD